VLLAILVLCLFGTICSFPTEWLHRIILWFAPINSTLRWQINGTLALLTIACSHCIDLHLHRTTRSHTEQTKRDLGLHNSDRRVRMGKSRILVPAWVCILAPTSLHHGPPNISNQISLRSMDDDRLRWHNSVSRPPVMSCTSAYIYLTSVAQHVRRDT
jgi:hypothetical protein